MKYLLKLIIPCIAALALFACQNNSERTFRVSDFKGTSWELVSAASPAEVKIPDNKDRPVFISFIDTKRVAGMAGVNRFNAPVKLEAEGKGKFEADFGMAASTMMAGPFLQFEQYFFKALKETDDIYVKGDTLVFTDDDDKILLTFKRNDALK